MSNEIYVVDSLSPKKLPPAWLVRGFFPGPATEWWPAPCSRTNDKLPTTLIALLLRAEYSGWVLHHFKLALNAS